MSVIDHKGRLFGKINLLDLVVVVAVLAVAGRYGYKHFMPNQTRTTGQDTTVEITVKLAKVSPETAATIRKGDPVVDGTSNVRLGAVSKVEVKPATIVEGGNEFISKYYSDVYVTIAGPGHLAPTGVTLGGAQQWEGAQLNLRSDWWKSSGYIVGVPRP